MRRIMYFRVAGKEVHMPRLIGAFILFAALLMFVRASALMFDSWDNLKYFEKCIEKIDPTSQAEFDECRTSLYKATGIYVKEGQGKLTSRQFWGALLGPIASVLFWLAVLFLGWIFYKTGDLIVPIEETIKTLPEKKRRTRKKK